LLIDGGETFVMQARQQPFSTVASAAKSWG
jgi:hypothetical protein